MTGPHVTPIERAGAATSLTLLDQARAGQPSAWGRLMALYRPLVALWCRRAGLQDADAEDVIQEVFAAVASHLHRFERREGRPGSFRTWLRVITASKLADLARRRRDAPHELTDAEVEALVARDGDGGAGAEEELATLFRRALQLVARDFHETTWRAFWRVAVEGAAAPAVAAELGVTVNAVYLAKGRVMQRLRDEFGADLDG